MKRSHILGVWLFVVAGHALNPSLDECRRLARENYPEIVSNNNDRSCSNRTEPFHAARAWIMQLAFFRSATLADR